MSATKLEIALSRKIPEGKKPSPHELTCIKLHYTHVALELEIHRLCGGDSIGSAEPDYGLTIGGYFDVSHDVYKIQHLHGVKAQAGAIRSIILSLQSMNIWALPDYARVTDHKWIHR